MLPSLIESLEKPGRPGDAVLVNQLIREYANTDLFRQPDVPYLRDNPFRRPLLTREFESLNLDQPLRLEELHSNASLIANRVLLSIYERDFVMLPAADFVSKRKDFETYYSERLRSSGEVIRPYLERYLFQCVEREVTVSGPWTVDAFVSYFEDYRARFTASDNQALMDTITSARDPVAAAKMYLIQLAGDFLVESSAMSRNVLGNFGPLQSALFKVVIDECGYGVHETKHSTLFQQVLRYCDLDPTPHTYWQLYLPVSLYLNNYYNYICKSHSHVFRYLGAILQVETAFRVTCRQMAAMMKAVFGPKAEVEYFTEHVHIDDHHSRMVLETLVVPAARQYGDAVLIDIVRGFEESQVIGQAYSQGLIGQLTWADTFARQEGSFPSELQDAPVSRIESATEKWTGSFIRDVDTLYRVESGQMEIISGYSNPVSLSRGQWARVPKHRLHGLKLSPGCVYTQSETA